MVINSTQNLIYKYKALFYGIGERGQVCLETPIGLELDLIRFEFFKRLVSSSAVVKGLLRSF